MKWKTKRIFFSLSRISFFAPVHSISIFRIYWFSILLSSRSESKSIKMESKISSWFTVMHTKWDLRHISQSALCAARNTKGNRWMRHVEKSLSKRMVIENVFHQVCAVCSNGNCTVHQPSKCNSLANRNCINYPMQLANGSPEWEMKASAFIHFYHCRYSSSVDGNDDKNTFCRLFHWICTKVAVGRKLHRTTWYRNCHAISREKPQTFDVFFGQFCGVSKLHTLFHCSTKAIWLNSNDKMHWTMWCISICPSTIDTKRAFSNSLFQRGIVWSLQNLQNASLIHNNRFKCIRQTHHSTQWQSQRQVQFMRLHLSLMRWIDRGSYVRLFARSFARSGLYFSVVIFHHSPSYFHSFCIYTWIICIPPTTDAERVVNALNKHVMHQP